jgi:acyl transferase domain-containing protein
VDLWDNIRQSVHFHQSISSILEDHPAAAFIEISPHPALSSYISAVGVPSNNVTCPMRRPSRHASGSLLNVTSFSETLNLLATLGINTIDLSTLYGRASHDPIYDIPYPFVTRHFPLRVDGPREPPAASGGTCSLRFKKTGLITECFSVHLHSLARYVLSTQHDGNTRCLVFTIQKQHTDCSDSKHLASTQIH